MGKLSTLLQETTIAVTDFMVKVKSGAGGDVLVTFQNLINFLFVKSTDANGWTVYNYGNWQEYRKRVTFSSVTVATGPTLFPISSNNLPVGISNIGGSTFLSFNLNATGSAGALNVQFEGSSASSTINFTASSADLSRSYSGYIDITLSSM